MSFDVYSFLTKNGRRCFSGRCGYLCIRVLNILKDDNQLKQPLIVVFFLFFSFQLFYICIKFLFQFLVFCCFFKLLLLF